MTEDKDYPQTIVYHLPGKPPNSASELRCVIGGRINITARTYMVNLTMEICQGKDKMGDKRWSDFFGPDYFRWLADLSPEELLRIAIARAIATQQFYGWLLVTLKFLILDEQNNESWKECMKKALAEKIALEKTLQTVTIKGLQLEEVA